MLNIPYGVKRFTIPLFRETMILSYLGRNSAELVLNLVYSVIDTVRYVQK